MSNNSLKSANNKDSNFIKRLPRGWTSHVIQKVQVANKLLPPNRQIPSDRGSIYSVAKRLSITHPLWPFIVEVAEQECISLKEYQEREDRLNQLLHT